VKLVDKSFIVIQRILKALDNILGRGVFIESHNEVERQIFDDG